MADLSMDILVTDTTAQVASNEDLSIHVQVSPELPESKPKEAQALDETQLAVSDLCVTCSLTLGRSFIFPETPRTLPTSSSLSISGSQPGASISNAVPAKGTPSAIGALKFHRHPAIPAFHATITPL
ncbi:hypothetical protein PAXINDRAFT_15769 [Paxillus involutus ATCC 200175]|uniref:Uncharacterized protein n=1 Tax=Paxillus involutus ATCC 200175 TaxID=664439 RepID=A0A0C9TU13_PAXIN|nr:hypothetical protein PAXINDRAFT_15769 [Paxillus involutus ATCC 200175]